MDLRLCTKQDFERVNALEVWENFLDPDGNEKNILICDDSHDKAALMNNSDMDKFSATKLLSSLMLTCIDNPSKGIKCLERNE